MPKSHGVGYQLKSGQLGAGEIAFMVVAAASPLGAIFVGVGASLSLGNGVGTPGVYLIASIVLMLFAVGFVAMSRHIKNAGAFYAYITAGLGKRLGYAAAIIALVSYNFYVVAITVFFGIFTEEAVKNSFDLEVSWEIWSVAGLALLAVLSSRKIQVGAWVLIILLLAEVVILTLLSGSILIQCGWDAFSFASFSPEVIFSGSVGVSIVYAFSSFTGFEATAIYAEEARDPERTVPRATFLALFFIAVFYVFTIWAIISGFDDNGAVEAARADPEGFVFDLNSAFVGNFTTTIMGILLSTSLFAALLAFHNATSRYIFALARDGALPQILSKTRAVSGSPFIASAVQLIFSALVLGVSIMIGVDAIADLAPGLLGVGALGILTLQAMASFAVIGYFRSRPNQSVWTTKIAPLLSGISLVVATFLAVFHFEELTQAKSSFFNNLWVLIPISILLGLIIAKNKEGKNDKAHRNFGMGGEPIKDIE